MLIQGGDEVIRCKTSNEEAIHRLLTAFFDYERPEVRDFSEAIELFRQDVPKVTNALRGIIIDAEASNAGFIQSSRDFLALYRECINPGVTREDVREMIIQHILTEDILNCLDVRDSRQGACSLRHHRLCEEFLLERYEELTRCGSIYRMNCSTIEY